MTGLPKNIIKKYGISKKAWAVFRRGRKSQSNPRRVRHHSVRKIGGFRRMARRFRRHRGRGGMTIPIAPIAGMIPMFARGVGLAMRGDTDGAMKAIVYDSIGYNLYNNTFDGARLISNMTPLVAGLLIHKFVGGSPLNLNKTLARAKVPFIRI